MSKEIYISSTPHETRLAIVEEEALSEIYYERENEYTLAGSIYNGRVTRVLPGMQSAFVDIGLDRDAFLYITDFLEEAADPEEFDTSGPRQGNDRAAERGGRGRRGGRERQPHNSSPENSIAPEQSEHHDFGQDEVHDQQSESTEAASTEDHGEGTPGADGSRRWRGRRGRRRGRGAFGSEPVRSNSNAGVPEADVEGGAPPEALENRAETSADQQNRFGERQGRGEQERGQRAGRFPRGFAPSRAEMYGIRGEESGGTGPIENAYPDIDAAGSAEPFILPGESLSKYRAPSDQSVATTSSTATASAFSPGLTPLAPPATLYTDVAIGWDGGAVLPGETLSRGSARQRQSDASPPSVPQPTQPIDKSGFSKAIDTNKVDSGSIPETSEAEFAGLPAEAPNADTADAENTEYEPESASASFRINPVPPSEFRNAPVAEPAEFQSGFGQEAPSETADEPFAADHSAAAHDLTSISSTGEMTSQPELSADEAAASHTAADETSPLHHEHAILSAEHADIDASVWPVELPGENDIPQGSDEEEPASTTLHASSIEEIEDEEETLEGVADLGVMLREMSIDQITRSGSEADELEEETLEEIEEYDASRTYTAHDDGVIEHGSQSFVEADEYEDSGVADEEEPTDTAAAEPAPQHREGERRGRRERRDGRKGRGERHGHGNGRARHSMQSTNLPAISDLLKPGQEILVQIAKEPIAKKGARITSHIALPGRFLVFMPTVNHTGVSRKIDSDAERRRLKDILLSEKGEASGGFIVRTAAEGASEDELRSDLRFLLNLWSDIKTRSESSKSPALIYHDLNLIERVLRDQVTDNFSAIWVDSETEYERVLRFLQRFQPSLIRRVKLYSKDTPLFEQFGITDEINKALKSKVWLKSGGSIVINQTEALVAIDINTGKFVGKTARLEDTIVKTNLDAIPEIVRQIRLRDLGGIIIIDFIDMDERKNRNRVMAALEDELKKDRAPSKVLQFNDFGLVAITRKRVKQSLERTLSVPCSVCSGTGMVKSPITVCNDIYIEMRKMQKHLDRGDVMLRVHPEIVKQLKASGARWLQEMEDMVGKTILVKSDPSLHPEQFDIH